MTKLSSVFAKLGQALNDYPRGRQCSFSHYIGFLRAGLLTASGAIIRMRAPTADLCAAFLRMQCRGLPRRQWPLVTALSDSRCDPIAFRKQ